MVTWGRVYGLLRGWFAAAEMIKVSKAGHWVHHDQLELLFERDNGVFGGVRNNNLKFTV
jgi:hypothetical protein